MPLNYLFQHGVCVWFLVIFCIKKISKEGLPRNRFPFDWKNPIGYSVAVMLCVRITAIPFCYIRTFLTLGAGSFLISLTVAADNQCDLDSINESIKAEQPREIILEQITEFIRFTHIKRFELF